MGAACLVCAHPDRGEIERRARSGSPLADIQRWIQSLDSSADARTRNPGRDAIARHLKNHAGVPANQPGPRPASGDFLATIRDNVWSRVNDGDLQPTTAEGIRAQEGIDRRAEKGADREVLLQMAQILGGALDWRTMIVPGESVRIDSPEDEAMELEAAEDNAYFSGLLRGEMAPVQIPRDVPKVIARR